ncbi:uncharacterized protein LOC123308311 [Coccinella septempunctata]|uniref:uncharacterized protein LOC123308311 n=1 Tax=Coccinella septempunctata TaxID=41139 RepID=UPI001D06B24F|nr:uncharacterized protein LOC123308311 [Coccinella septempunctata]
MMKIGQIHPDKKTGSFSNLSLETPRHIEFIGVHQKNRKKTTNSIDTSSEDEKRPTRKQRKKYKSTISTKTSKQDVSGNMKERKSILKADSGSSILTDVKQMQEKVVVPPLDLKSLETRTTSYPSRDPYNVSYGSTPEKTKRATPRKTRKFRRTNKTEKRLKGGANIPMSAIEREKFRRENSELFEAPSCQPTGSQELSSPLYPFQSNLHSSESALFSSFERSDSTKLDLRYFESSDTSFSPIVSGE